MLSLFQGDLPDMSPHGEHRIKVPVEQIVGDDSSKCNLYYVKDYYSKSEVQYIRIVLVKENQTEEKKWCDKNFYRIKQKNDVLKLCKSGKMRCVKAYNREDRSKLYTEVFVVGNVEDLDKKEAKWDMVRDIGRGSF